MRAFVLMLIPLLFIGRVYGDDKYLPDVQKLIDGIITAKYHWERHSNETGYAALFRKVGVGGLQKLKSHPDDSIALQAAWQEVELSTPKEVLPGTKVVDRKKLEDFLKFMETRCKTTPPAWWKESLLHANINRRYNIWLPLPNPDIYHKAGIGNLRSPLNTTLTRVGANLRLRVGADSIELPDSMFRKSDSDKILGEGISAFITHKCCYVALHDDVGYPYKLTCLDRSSGKIIWQSEVWGSFWGVAVGQHVGRITVIEQDKRIFVYGVASGFHVEAFNAEDGKNLFRFSNSYQ